MSTAKARRDASPSGLRASGEEFTEAVLRVIESIPPGRVLAYGDIAELLGVGGPRQVGAVLSRHGSAVPWWRVPHADGSPPDCSEVAARKHWRAEGTPTKPNGNVDMRRARWEGRTP
ncbi:MAG TPA: MGMT family protein [Sporichthyaceae bacterium]|nr:MGMT family protein [Sporichthyaceae bacterium]